MKACVLQRPKPKPEAFSPAQTPARRCAGLMESCSSLTPCCDPCASCHCRLFNTICHCWRLGHLCPKKTWWPLHTHSHMQINDPKHTRTHIDLMTLNTRTHTHTHIGGSQLFILALLIQYFLSNKKKEKGLWIWD